MNTTVTNDHTETATDESEFDIGSSDSSLECDTVTLCVKFPKFRRIRNV